MVTGVGRDLVYMFPHCILETNVIRSSLLTVVWLMGVTQAADLFFDQVVARMISSFESRCLTVYGPAHSLVRSDSVRRHTRAQKCN